MSALIAREAGVTRALVHHYIGGVRDVYLEVLGEMTGEIPGSGREERVARNDLVERTIPALEGGTTR